MSPTLLGRLAFVVVLVSLWHWSQRAIGSRGLATDNGIGDKVHEWMTPLHAYLTSHPAAVRWLLITSSLGIDFLGLFVLHRGIFGPSAGPLLGLALLLALRQGSQYLTALPPPRGMIWRDPGVPSLFVTYHVENDLFFSGHTALAVFGCLTLGSLGPGWLCLGLLLGGYEIFTVLALRAHWTMDVYAGFVTAILCYLIACVQA